MKLTQVVSLIKDRLAGSFNWIETRRQGLSWGVKIIAALILAILIVLFSVAAQKDMVNRAIESAGSLLKPSNLWALLD